MVYGTALEGGWNPIEIHVSCLLLLMVCLDAEGVKNKGVTG